MPKAAWPTADDVKNYLIESSIPVPGDDFDWDSATAWPVAEFEKAKGWRPFLARTEDSVRQVNVSGSVGLMPLPHPAVSITSVKDGPNGATNNSAIAQPVNAPDESLPYTMVQFAPRFTVSSGIVVIAARWGYSATVPDDLWQAVLVMAAVKVAEGSLLTEGGEWKLGPLTEKVNTDAIKAFLSNGKKMYDEVTSNYRRTT